MGMTALWIPFYLLLLFLLLLHPLVYTDSTCQSSNEYLDAMYRCRRSDFRVKSFCSRSNWSTHELSCNRSYRIAIYSAHIGPSQDQECSEPETTFSSSSSSPGYADAGANGACCIVSAVDAQCHRRQKCNLKTSDLLKSIDDVRCSQRSRDRHQQSLRLTVSFICVTPKIMKEIDRDSSSPDGFCEGTVDANNGETMGGEQRSQPVDIHRAKSTPTVRNLKRPEVTDNVRITTSGVNRSTTKTVSASSATSRSAGVIDWIWSYLFIKDNMDRFLIYLFLSIAIGVILVLLVVILGLCFGYSVRKRKSASSYDSHVIQSSTQTSDVASSLIASNYTPGVEMVHYGPSECEYTQPLTRARPVSSGTAPISGNSVHFATESAILLGGPASSSANGGNTVQRMNVPQYRIDTSMDSVDSGRPGGGGGGRMQENDDYRSSTLGRFYTNPYRHDSYRSDGYRTLQHK